jgi:hypothetical protein
MCALGCSWMPPVPWLLQGGLFIATICSFSMDACELSMLAHCFKKNDYLNTLYYNQNIQQRIFRKNKKVKKYCVRCFYSGGWHLSWLSGVRVFHRKYGTKACVMRKQ